ncbi:hypothetical protein MTBBW1_460013 [Desulfamplus magnetovallimortis]|uniref:Uncharacterized protein n=1 Tax=Desulfamplus magnetovallimortis TaxID=1246637 RepID=A0A1W1HH77_9BACT|nr:type II toxin-antitoxin system PemK/MazF family toxin [Desulfamplus magnetovallimortis]SLM31857.1 hypothetical protein MTBBW1_460013 [Desulfamplus magnetovallimortis]
MPVYIPDQGDLVAITFDPQSGHEQKGRRPAFVVSKFLESSWCGSLLRKRKETNQKEQHKR